MFPSGLNGEHVLQALGIALRKEEEQWKPVFPRTGCGEVGSVILRNIVHLCWLNYFLNFSLSALITGYELPS